MIAETVLVVVMLALVTLGFLWLVDEVVSWGSKTWKATKRDPRLMR